nr:MAG TPA: hypothetical protein [Bacteriophage sp.]DAU06371.1 MAG TPA: hypothetical protein [Caudoviricetes sp.]DAX21827.1 MAG TPA: hypothetical protein [Caudoviricetes sp.]
MSAYYSKSIILSKDSHSGMLLTYRYIMPSVGNCLKTKLERQIVT